MFRFALILAAAAALAPSANAAGAKVSLASVYQARLQKVALNPQPLPPRYIHLLKNRYKKVMLNPQPLPPNPCKCPVRVR